MRKAKVTPLFYASLFFFLLIPAYLPAQEHQNIAPAKSWEYYSTAEDAGFTSDGIEEAYQQWLTISERATAVICVYRGKILVEWGDSTFNYMCHSVRKSFMSAMYGIHTENGNIDLNDTIAELGIDDDPPITEAEKQAKVIHLLKARSGIYHPAAAETPEMRAQRPPRGSHAPDTYWYYNNWDFNALGTIFIQETGQDIFEEFERAIGDPIGMEDFDPAQCQYNYQLQYSIHPQYAFRMSARDRARFGQLFLQKGRWGNQQLITESWVEESTKSYSDASQETPELAGLGYGYLWWSFSDTAWLFSYFKNIPEISFYFASGYGGHIIAVLPDAEMVFVMTVDTDSGYSVVLGETLGLLDLIMAARTFEFVDFDVQKASCSRKTLSSGDSARFVAKVKNMSKQKSKVAEVQFYFSADKALDKKDLFLGTSRLPALKANKKKTIRANMALPSGIKAGQYYLLAVVESGGNNRDSHFANDMAVSKRKVLIK